MFLVAGLACVASAADAADYRAREVGGWNISAADDGEACIMSLDYEGEGETSLIFSLKLDGDNLLAMMNYNWSIKEGEKLDLEYRLSNGTYEKHPSFGFASGGKKGFGTQFENKFSDYLAQSKYLHVYRDGKVVDNVSLTGTGVAVAELRRCLGIIRANDAAEAREKARFSHIPLDPFATPSEVGKKE